MEITAHFKMIFLTVFGITMLCLVGLGALALFGSDAVDPENISVMEKNFHAACEHGWQLGLGTVFGLIGGKATAVTDN